MARILSTKLEQAMSSERRRPAYSVEVFDLRSTRGTVDFTRINDVVLYLQGSASIPSIVGPRVFTNDTISIDLTENAGDYIQQGIAATTLQAQIADVLGTLDPQENPPTALDPEAEGRWLRQGNAIVVRRGDLAEPDQSEWPITFVGRIQGQPGIDRNRTTGTSVISLKAASREVDFLRQINTSRNFEESTPLQTIIEELATIDMGLAAGELNIPTITSRITAFKSTQFIEESPLVSIAKVLFLDGLMPRFEGDGRLGITDTNTAKVPTRNYPQREQQVTIVRPILEYNGTNDVIILGLDSNLSAVIQDVQELARAGITTGFFSRGAQIPVRWSEDETQQAFNVSFRVLSSIGESPFAFGSESFTNLPLTDGGSVAGRIDVDGAIGAGLLLIGLVLGVILVSIKVFDFAITSPTGGVAPVIPTGRSILTFGVQAAMAILGQQGRGEYRIVGQPYEYVFAELRSQASVANVPPAELQTIEIENHLINTQADCDAVAARVLLRERQKQNVRTITMIDDLAVEPDDVISIGEGAAERRFMVKSIALKLARGEAPIATLQCFEVTGGVKP